MLYAGPAPRGQPVDYTPCNIQVRLRVNVHRWDELPLDKVTEMIARKTIVGARHTLVQSYLKKGAIVPLHSHHDEQMIYVLQGALRAVVAGDGVTLREGDVLQIPAGAAHQAEALDDTFVMDVRISEVK